MATTTKKAPAKGRPTPFVFSDREGGSIEVANTGQGIEAAMREAGRIKKQRQQDAVEAPAREAAAAERAVVERDQLAQQLQQAKAEKASLARAVSALMERVSALEAITPNTEKAAATAAQTALLIDRQYQLSEQLEAQQQAVDATAVDVRDLTATASAEAAAAEASREQTLAIAKNTRDAMNGVLSNTSANFERLQNDINAGRDRISAATQVLMDNAETITRLNHFEDHLQTTLASMEVQIKREVSEASERSIAEQMSVLAGAIGLDQAQLDLYLGEIQVGARRSLPVITENYVSAFRAYAKSVESER